MTLENQHEVRTVYAPLGALQALVRGARNQSDEEHALQQRLDEQRQRIALLKAKTADVEHTLAQYKTDHRQSVATPPSARIKRQAQAVRAPTGRLPTPPSQPTAPQTDMNHLLLSYSPPAATRLLIAKERVAQLEEVMTSVKEISAQGEFEEVIARTLGAAQKLVRADKYTLGLLNERRNVVEIFSAGPWRKKQTAAVPTSLEAAPRERIYSTFGIAPSPTKSKSTSSTPGAARAVYAAEGFLAADSATTFGRVIMTGKPLHIEDFFTHEAYHAQIKSGNKGASPKALLCMPICNAHSAVVGVLQVVAMNMGSVPASPPPTPSKQLSQPSPVFLETDTRSLEFLVVVAGAAI